MKTLKKGTTEWNILKLYEADSKVASDDKLLIARYWWVYDKWDPQLDLYTNLKNSTTAETITRARRWLIEYNYIEPTKEADEKRYRKFVESRNEYGEPVMIEMEG